MTNIISLSAGAMNANRIYHEDTHTQWDFEFNDITLDGDRIIALIPSQYGELSVSVKVKPSDTAEEVSEMIRIEIEAAHKDASVSDADWVDWNQEQGYGCTG